jgi:hypothetical protein
MATRQAVKEGSRVGREDVALLRHEGQRQAAQLRMRTRSQIRAPGALGC